MIHSFDIIDPTNTPVPWWVKVEALSKPRTFEFKPGLNILWGRNGSGKSTIIKCLTRLFHCGQSGNPVMTQESVRDLFEPWSNFGPRKDDIHKLGEAVKLAHDNQGVRFFDPSNTVGLIGGGAAFDWDFGTEGIQNTMFKGSSGQTTMFRFDKLLGSLMKQEPAPKVEYRAKSSEVNDHWGARYKIAESFLKGGTAEKGQATVLLDEPERSFDINYQVALWRMLRSISLHTQVIVASHCLFALRIPEANYIEMSPEYLVNSEMALILLENWAREKPKPIDPKVVTKAQAKTKPPTAKKGPAAPDR